MADPHFMNCWMMRTRRMWSRKRRRKIWLVAIAKWFWYFNFEPNFNWFWRTTIIIFQTTINILRLYSAWFRLRRLIMIQAIAYTLSRILNIIITSCYFHRLGITEYNIQLYYAWIFIFWREQWRDGCIVIL